MVFRILEGGPVTLARANYGFVRGNILLIEIMK